MNKYTFSVENFEETKLRLLTWASQFRSCCFLDNHQYHSPWQQQECLVAADALHSIQANAGHALEQLDTFIKQHNGQWLFGHLAYDLKNETDSLQSLHEDHIGFPDLHFFVPKTVVQLYATEVVIHSHENEAENIWKGIQEIEILIPDVKPLNVNPKPRISKAEYIEIIKKLRAHILRGDCYEINFCQDFFAENIAATPVHLYNQLSQLSPNPFSGYYRLNESHLMCASPERYLMKKGNQIYSQPIKGTAARNLASSEDDNQRKDNLYHSQKDRSENVMVVDLVRNDLSKICQEATVKVDELFGIYSYPNVHQMISTISGTLQAGLSFADIIKATFPMGSMTGAPKLRVMQLIEQYEASRRGIFSGAMGYIAPDGDFDFNVVIRSLLYNAATQYLSYQVGGGITWYSEAEAEYEECLLKAEGMRRVLGGQ